MTMAETTLSEQAQLELVRTRHIRQMELTALTLQHIMARVDDTLARTARDPDDGDKGWTTLEVLCHLRDYDEIFYERAQMMVAGGTPDLPRYEHEALAVERRYNEQDPGAVLAALVQTRARSVAFFTGLTPAQWQTAGIHPERGLFTMTDAAMQVGQHDVLHIEQITKILANA